MLDPYWTATLQLGATLRPHSQSIISQLFTSSRTISLCRSIFQCEYNDRVAAAALRCPRPAPPFIASSCDLHTQVARFLPSLSGFPNQYLLSVNALFRMDTGPPSPEEQRTLTSESHRWLSLLHALPYPRPPDPHTPSWAGSVIEKPR